MTFVRHASSAVLHLDERHPGEPEANYGQPAELAWNVLATWLADDAASSSSRPNQMVEADLERLIVELEADWLLGGQ